MTDSNTDIVERLREYNARLTSIIENDRLDTESKNLAIGLLVTLNASFFRTIPDIIEKHRAAIEALHSTLSYARDLLRIKGVVADEIDNTLAAIGEASK